MGTSMGKPLGSYYIPENKFDELVKVYSNTIETNKIIPNLTQKPSEISPILFDLDFKYELDNNKRNYTDDGLYKIIQECFDFLNDYIILNQNNNKCFVFERETP